MPLLKRIRKLAVLCVVVISVASTYAQDCQDGTPHPDKCLAELKSLDQKLQGLYKKEKQRLISLYGGDYGESEPGAYAKEAVAAFEREAEAWKKYRQAKCRYEALSSGMSLQYAGSVSAACEVEETNARVKHLQKAS